MSDGMTQQNDRPHAPRRVSAPGTTIPRLAFPEQLVLWSARRLAAARHDAAAIETDARACRQAVRDRVASELGVALRSTGGAGAGRAAAEALERTLDIFASAGVRSLHLNPLCCRFVSNDERLFMSFLASCQEGDGRHTSALLSWFLPPAAARIAVTDGAAFAAALIEAGFRLPQRFRFATCAGFPRAAGDAAASQTMH